MRELSINKEPKIVTTPAKIIAGLKEETTLSATNSFALWQQFGPYRSSLKDRVTSGSYHIQVYSQDVSSQPLLPSTIYTRWVGVEVTASFNIPNDLEKLIIPEGTWAVFEYVGTARDFGSFASYIYSQWLPNSKFQLADRPHFEYLPESYLGPTHPEAREEVWVPIQ